MTLATVWKEFQPMTLTKRHRKIEHGSKNEFQTNDREVIKYVKQLRGKENVVKTFNKRGFLKWTKVTRNTAECGDLCISYKERRRRFFKRRCK